MATKHAEISNWRNELTPNIVDQLANVAPDGSYALYPNSPVTYEEGYRTVTYKEFSNAINGLAWWLHETLGPSTNFDVLAYIGPNDIRYNALMLGASKAGYLVFFTSPRNSIAAHGELFEKTKCRTLLTSNPTPPVVEAILGAHPLQHFQIPSVTDLLGENHPHYPYNKTYEENKFDPIAILHTSGSTGMPKPVTWTHETFSRHMNMTSLEAPTGFQSVHKLHQGKRILNTFPPFHAASFGVGLCNSLPYGTVPIAPISGAIPSAEGLVQALKAAPAEVAFLIPLIAVELAQKPALLEYCSQHLKHIFYAGGHLPKAVGDVIAAKIPIHCQYGATEIGLSYQLLSPDMTGADWQYTRYHPELGFEFEEVTPGLFELVVKRDPRYERNQVTFTMGLTLEDHSAYRTRDLFEKHATLTDSWGWRARADDIIVFLNGEKTNPISMEQYIVANNEDVANAMVVGMQRFQAALIVEPVATLGKLSPGEATVFIEKIWPTVEEANKSTPAHARIEKSMVMVTDPDKPIMRSGKGTIQRQGSVSQYAAEIDQLYSRLETGLFGCKPASVNTKDTLEVSRFIRRAISQINPDLLQEGTDSFFSLGMDSLMAMRLVRALRHGLGRSDVDVSVVYNNPSVRQLTEYVVGGQTAGERDAPPQHTELEALLKEYEQVIGGALNKPTSPPPGPLEFVVLTGSTGSLGTHLLEAFLANPTIAHIYCLNRRGDAEDLHEAKAKAAGFQLDQHRHRVSFIHADLAQPNLGLDGTTYNVLRSTATLIVHNAWPVNFIMPLNTFRPQFDGLINLFRLASRAEPPKVLYISSISSVAQLSTNSDSRVIPEEVIEDFEAPQDIGYAKSKLLSELLCDFAARCLHIPVSVARVGQVAGPVGAKSTGLWNTTEWLPSLIITSMSFGALPDDLGAELNKVDWIPADLLAEALVELGTNKGQESHVGTKAEVFNVVSPRTTTWEKLLPSIVSSLKKHTNENVSVVPLQSWLQQLQKCVDDFSAGNVDLAHTHPAIKLQNFYERAMLNRKGPVEWETAHATAKSKTLKEMPAVRNQWVEKWVQVWIAELMSRRKDHVLTTLVSMGGFRR